MQPLFNTFMHVYSSVIISNDDTSKKINIHKDTEIQTFYQEILLQFPNIQDLKLFYYEGYSLKKLYISNEREYIIANKKGIEYFYLCGNNSNDILDYLRYHSVMLFCPVQRLNDDYQINQRKKMQIKNIIPINQNQFGQNSNINQDNQYPNINNNMNVQNNLFGYNNMQNANYNNFNFNINQNIDNLNNQMNNLNLNNSNQQQFDYFPYIPNFNNINNNFNKINKTNPQKKIPEYETIDTEPNPVNRYIENAINYSNIMKYFIIAQQNAHPEYFINIEETLSSPGLLYQNFPSNMDYQYILSLIGKILVNKGIKVGIYKQGYNINRIDLSAVQFIFSGLINRKKYRLKFSQNISFTNIINDLSCRKKFIEKWKIKISNILGMDKSFIILTNARENGNFLYLDLAFNLKVQEIRDKILITTLVKGDIIKCEAVPLLAGCILSPNIFSSQYNKYYNFMKPNIMRGREEYIHPFQWTAYGINICGKYDFGNNTWLGNKNIMGEFAVAYHGINNINPQKIKKIDSIMGNLETGKTFIKVKNIRNPNKTCKFGVYVYKNPLHAENSSDIITIGGLEYKIMFMCRVNTSKINQPENFKDCWILSPSPDEIRPYKILIKKIPKSPLAIASQGEIKICRGSPPSFYFDIIKQRDESYMNNLNNFNGNMNIMNNNFIFNNQNNQNVQNKYDLVLKEWTGSGALKINNYLRNNIKALPEPILKSNVWCLHKAITKGINNVPNNTTVYRGIKAKIPFNIGVGTKFYFQEFLSTSKDINIARNFANFGTLMIISIQNNGTNGKKVYCRDIENISNFNFEKEIIFTAFCQFKVTKIEKQNNLDVIYLTCDGYNF